MKRCPRCNRTYTDNTLRFCLEDGSLLSQVRDAEVTVVMSTGFDTTLTDFRIDDPVVAICINQQFKHCKTADELYQCTRGLWRMSKARAENAKYVFAVFKGDIKEVYEIERWSDATKSFKEFWLKRLRGQGKIIDPTEHDGRIEFIGRVASERIRRKYVGKALSRRHGQNPILYFNC